MPIMVFRVSSRETEAMLFQRRNAECEHTLAKWRAWANIQTSTGPRNTTFQVQGYAGLPFPRHIGQGIFSPKHFRVGIPASLQGAKHGDLPNSSLLLSTADAILSAA